MKFYDLLQKDPSAIKQLIKESGGAKEKRTLWLGIIVRAFLIVAFAIAFIAPLGAIFGSENNAMAVALFCILLSVRFVDFGYCIGNSMINLAVVFSILCVSPVLAYNAAVPLKLVIHFLSVFAIMLMTCDSPEMGNGGLYSFAYVFLCGNPVSGDGFVRRAMMTAVGFVICGLVFYFKHRDKNKGVRFIDKLKQFSMYEKRSRWQLRLGIGVSVLLTLFAALGVERFMWAGFACGSLLSDYSDRIHRKLIYRIVGVVSGCVLFYIVYSIFPPSLHALIGPIGGFCLGFCTDYRYKTLLNCFGALMLAAGIYGLNYSVVLRIENNLLGVAFAIAFYYIYEFLVTRRFAPSEE